jgi:hypothetical protein
MGFQADIADALLGVIKDCVDCSRYDRVLWQLGDPNIECSTIGVGLLDFPIAAEMPGCAVNELRLNIIVAQCCFPTGDDKGNPPPSDKIIEASRCVVDDVERIMCCIRSISFEIPGTVQPCRPTILAPKYTRPSGGCLVAKIGMTIPGVPCCD